MTETTVRPVDYLVALEGTRTAAWEWDIADDVVTWSQNLGVLYGRPRGYQPATYQEFLQLVHQDDRHLLDEAVARAVSEGLDYEVDHRTVWPDGSLHWLGARGHVVIGEGGRPERLIGIVHDITDRRRRADQDRLLAQAGDLLSASTDYRSTLARVAQIMVPAVADWCAVQVVEGDRLESVAVAHVDPNMVALAARLQEEYPTDLERPGGAGDVLRTGQSLLYQDIPDELLVAAAHDERHLGILRSLGMRAALTVPLQARGRVFGLLALISAESRTRFDETDVAFAEELGRRAGVAIDLARLLDETHRARVKAEENAERVHRLQGVIGELSRSMDMQGVAKSAVRQSVAAVNADRGALVIAGDGRLRVVETVGYGRERLTRFGDDFLSVPGPLAQAYAEGQPVFMESLPELVDRYPELAETMAGIEDGAFVALPVGEEGKRLGVLGLVFEQARVFSQEDRELLTALTQHIGFALDRARLFEETSSVAATLQRALAPPRRVDRPGVEAVARYQPAGVGEIGGDWYDVIDGPDGRIFYVLGDVVGRGIPAVAAMAQLRHSVRMLLLEGRPPGSALAALDRLARAEKASLGATVMVAELAPAHGMLRVASAGHLPLVVTTGGDAKLVYGGGNPPLGVGSPAPAVEEVALESGSVMVMFTDGLIERRGEDLELALQRLLERVRSTPAAPKALADVLMLDSSDIDDDVTLLIARLG